ncbi:MAG: ABC transporter ATP-binding protein [Candidatus Terrybacteria bacterium RIFCSPHIGHO2_01_FULL_48_17]|uniref:ABC transporter ATP-binding protein n=1 Tax=Candidatus Terrybacteria bacterium RIFCSPHIGHO2_01_FULL_48_17 TaxID=1802362 RepID=A0A1G2PM17_9BACT|nr:MAG: ABC transporter ATP-binding protein [Candidatus Terrybacteria bacterium RIFCSPHIGHO2_01_FULL_48_17]OHA51888.1 MAG: ABC transporter ATP-binding protein [Candidatus Terrybacteria bacterium RIFCSPLOWO2_01_FULL_48_14]
MEQGEVVLEVKNLQVAFGNDVVLDKLSFAVHRGDIVAILGPNGAGKTVLFRTLLGLLPYAGSIEWAKHIKLGYVPQRFGVERDLPLTVEEFFSFKTGERPRDLAKVLEDVELKADILNKKLGVLSGGQLQRVLIAWALVGSPDVLLIDEATTSVDMPGAEEIYRMLERLKKQHNLTILLISHDLNVVYRYAAHVVCVNRSQVCYGSIHDALTPEVLQKVYGGERGFYQHLHHEHQH